MSSEISLSIKLLTVASFLLKNDYNHRLNANLQEFKNVYDFIVVGSGSAGGIVAHRLAESGVDVLLLEAGGPNGIPNDIPIEYLTLFGSECDWNYTMAKQFVGQAFVGGVIPENRGKVLGGSSSINAMIFNRGNRRDFDLWAHQFGAVGWSYEEVLPYFKKYERNTDPRVIANGLHGTSGPLEVWLIFFILKFSNHLVFNLGNFMEGP